MSVPTLLSVVVCLAGCSHGIAQTRPSVPAVPPDTVPAWFANDSSFLDGGTGPLKRVIVVRFDPSASQAQRQAAVNSVSGTVVGGSRMGASDGFYDVYVPTAVTLPALDSVIAILKRQPLVDMASYYGRMRDFYRRPDGGAGEGGSGRPLRPGATQTQ